MKLVNENLLYEMAILRKEKTGLPIHLWVDDSGFTRDIRHNLPRLKMQANKSDSPSRDNLIPISISSTPMILAGKEKLKMSLKDLKEVIKYIKDNYDLFLAHYNQEIDLDELKEKLIERGAYKLKA